MLAAYFKANKDVYKQFKKANGDKSKTSKKRGKKTESDSEGDEPTKKRRRASSNVSATSVNGKKKKD